MISPGLPLAEVTQEGSAVKLADTGEAGQEDLIIGLHLAALVRALDWSISSNSSSGSLQRCARLMMPALDCFRCDLWTAEGVGGGGEEIRE